MIMLTGVVAVKMTKQLRLENRHNSAGECGQMNLFTSIKVAQVCFGVTGSYFMR